MKEGIKEMINRESVETMKYNLEAFLGMELGIDTKKNFRCLHPEHHDTNPSAKLCPDSKHVYCFKCGRYDLYDIVGWEYDLKSFPEKYQKVMELAEKD